MSLKPAPAPWHRTKIVLAIIAAIVASPVLLLMLLAGLSGERR